MTQKIISILTTILITASVLAQVPEKMSYQAVVRDGSNDLVTEAQVGMQISILQGSPSGTAVYVETQTPTTNTNGLVSLEIGSGTVVSGTFATIDWGNGPYFIKTETDPTGGSNYTISGTSQLMSVPYAFHAKTAESVNNMGSYTHYIGELFGGGVVVYVWKENGVEHGLIASLSDLSANSDWSSTDPLNYQNIGALSPVDGQANTSAIIAAGDVGGAAYLCDNYSNQGFSDWYLPAIWELNKCFEAALTVNIILGENNGFKFHEDYCSSTYLENDGVQAHGFDGSSNYGFGNYRVRAVRRF